MRKLCAVFVLIVALGAGPAGLRAAEPPEALHYQGVLRSAAGAPLSGSFDIVFRFFDAPSGGDELLADGHTGAGAVAVSGGLFNVELGTGALTAGLAASLGEMFGEFAAVHMQIEVAGEVLSPRIRLVSAGFSLNANNLDGKDSAEFIDTSSNQVKTGNLSMDGSTGGGTLTFDNGAGLVVNGGSIVLDGAASEAAARQLLGPPCHLRMQNGCGIQIKDVGSNLEIFDGGRLMIDGTAGSNAMLTDGADLELLGGDLMLMGGGELHVMGGSDVMVMGDAGGGGNLMITGDGAGNGGDLMVMGDGAGGGNLMVENGANLEVTDGGHLMVGNGSDMMITGDGAGHGGELMVMGDGAGGGNLMVVGDGAGGGNVTVDGGDLGIQGQGELRVATDSRIRLDGSSELSISETARVSFDAGGQITHDNTGWIFDTTTPTKIIMKSGPSFNHGALRIDAAFEMWSENGSFIFRTGASGGQENLVLADDGDLALGTDDGDLLVARGSVCVDADGSCNPGAMNGRVTALSYSTGSSDLAEVYPSDEVLEAGDVVVIDALAAGKVRRTNTPYEAGLLTVVSRAPGLLFGAPSDEEVATSGLDPASTTFGDLLLLPGTYPVVLAGRVDVRVNDEGGAIQPGDFLASSSTPGVAMRARRAGSVLGQAVSAWTGPGEGRVAAWVMPRWNGGGAGPPASGSSEDGVGSPAAATTSISESAALHSAPAPTGTVPRAAGSNVAAESFRAGARELATNLRVSEPVETGDVLVADRERPGSLELGRSMADPAVVGVVSGEAGLLLDAGTGATDGVASGERAAVVFSGIVPCRVDAGYGRIEVGDLLTTSPTPGHAMRAAEPLAGTIVGKALEPLDAGTGVIEILVMLR